MKTEQSLKRFGQRLLVKTGLYHRLRASSVYDLYWRVADRRVIDASACEVTFYRSLLKEFTPGDVIFDVGANEGYKTGIFLRLGAKVVAIEPDESNQRVLRQSFHERRLVKKPVVVIGNALSDTNGTGTLWVDAPGSAKNTLSQKWVETLRHDEARFGERLNFADQKQVTTTTLDDLIAQYGRPIFVKIDVEGAEPDVLRGLHSPVPYLSFEVNLPEFRPEGLECIDLLDRIFPEGTFNYAVDCQGGFALEKWLPADRFSRAFEECHLPSIEVFWTSVRA